MSDDDQNQDDATASDKPVQPGSDAASGDDGFADDMVEKAEQVELVDAGGDRDDADLDSGVVSDARLDVILNIPITFQIEVGRAKLTIRDLLKLNHGSVVELDRLAGEPLDVLVNGTLIAHGEIVVVNDKFGIRLTDVISQADRIKKLV